MNLYCLYDIEFPLTNLTLNNSSYELITVVTSEKLESHDDEDSRGLYRVYNRNGSDWFCYAGSLVFKA